MGIYTMKFEQTMGSQIGSTPSIISQAMSMPDNVRVYTTEDGKSYIPGTDLEDYMFESGIFDIGEALDRIVEVNPGIYRENIIIANNGIQTDIVKEALQESIQENVILEKSVEDDAMNLKQAQKYYDECIKACKKKADSKKQIENRIKVLEKCVKDMEEQKKKPIKDGGMTKYQLKAIIPLNGLYRLIKDGDITAGLSNIASIVGFVAGFTLRIPALSGVGGYTAGMIRAQGYKKMLDDNIKKTEEAIAYLKGELKKMK